MVTLETSKHFSLDVGMSITPHLRYFKKSIYTSTTWSFSTSQTGNCCSWQPPFFLGPLYQYPPLSGMPWFCSLQTVSSYLLNGLLCSCLSNMSGLLLSRHLQLCLFLLGNLLSQILERLSPNHLGSMQKIRLDFFISGSPQSLAPAHSLVIPLSVSTQNCACLFTC